MSVGNPLLAVNGILNQAPDSEIPTSVSPCPTTSVIDFPSEHLVPGSALKYYHLRSQFFVFTFSRFLGFYIFRLSGNLVKKVPLSTFLHSPPISAYSLEWVDCVKTWSKSCPSRATILKGFFLMTFFP